VSRDATGGGGPSDGPSPGPSPDPSPGPAPDPSEHVASRWVEHDRALSRFEDLLTTLPLDRAVPDLAELLHRAQVDEDLLRRDDRARKLLHEALMARPYGHLDVVTRVRTEVELLTLEVELLTDRLADPTSEVAAVRRAEERLREVRRRLDALRDAL
jgi:septation ring formation regulator EzrA